MLAAHALFKAEGLVRWSLFDIPDYADEAYVLVAAYLGADDFSTVAKPEWLAMGLKMIQSGVHLPVMGDTLAENF